MTTSWAGRLEISFDDLRSDRGDILFLIFNKKEGYPDRPELSFKQGKISTLEAKASGLTLKDIPNGEFVVTVIHDENSNDKLDTNFLGIPKEGFGFSNNPTVFMGPPSYKRCQFKVTGDTSIKIRMKYF